MKRKTALSERELAESAMIGALIGRCRRFGLNPSPENIRRMNDPRLSYMLGVYNFEHDLGRPGITEAQRLAGEQYGFAQQSWLNANGLSCVPLGDGVGGFEEPDFQAMRDRARLSEEALKDAGRGAFNAVNAVVMHDRRAKVFPDLVAGLDALMLFFDGGGV